MNTLKLDRELDELAFKYLTYDDLNDCQKVDLSMLMIEEDKEHWVDNDEIFTNQIKRMLLDITQQGDPHNVKLYDMQRQLEKNIVAWCEEDLRYRLQALVDSKILEDKYYAPYASRGDYEGVDYL